MELAAVFLPLLGCILAGLFGRWLGDRGAMAVSVAGVVLAALASIWLFVEIVGGEPRTVTLANWITSGDFVADWALRFDTLTVVMLLVVNGVSALVHIYSIGYMSHDPARPRFFAYLSLFTFAMLMLVTADNLVQLFFGWEGVGLASYLLIGFWYERDSARAAAMKAFIVNRVGDFGFALGIFAVFLLTKAVSEDGTGSIQFDAVFALAPAMAATTFDFLGWQVNGMTAACLLLFLGAMGKSAQLGLHTWLPDAMEGPTPVSALIHAATMVTAGVFMVARLSPLFEQSPDALMVVTLVGAATAFVAATIGFTQFDIKRVIAYSTMSQLGYMFFAAGVSAYSAAIFHLFTHAFFKALLFLGAGSVIHALSGEQDMRRMGGIWRLVPWTYAMMWIGSLALAGIGIPHVFGFAGFYSKDIVLEAAYAHHSWYGELAYWLGIAAAFLTAFYSWRLIFLTFHGTPRADHHTMEHIHESPWVMLGPLLVLALGATFAGVLGYHAFVGEGTHAFWEGALFGDRVEEAHHVPFWVQVLPVLVGLAGIALAWLFYMRNPGLPGRLAAAFHPVHVFLFRKWYFDELYDAVFVRPARFIGHGLWTAGDVGIIDALGPDGIAAASQRLSRWTSRLQTGYLYHYAFAMLIGVVALVSWYLWTIRG